MTLSVAVTGGTGFLGRRLVQTLSEQDVTIRCLVRPTSDVTPLLEGLPPDRRDSIEIVRGELTDRQFLDAQLPEIDVLYHLAAALHVDTASLTERTVGPTRQLIDAALEVEVGRFVLVSSIGVYGTAGLTRGCVVDESTPIEPHPERRDPYTISKLEQERIAWQALDQDRLPLVVVRPGVIYGPGRSPVTSRVGLKLGPLLLRMGGHRPLPYTYVDNCASAVMLAGLVPGTDAEAYNIVDDELPTGRMILSRMRRHGRRVRSLGIPQHAIDPLAAVCEFCYAKRGRAGSAPMTRYQAAALWSPLRYSNAKARHSLNWSPEISLEEGLMRTFTAGVQKSRDRFASAGEGPPNAPEQVALPFSSSRLETVDLRPRAECRV